MQQDAKDDTLMAAYHHMDMEDSSFIENDTELPRKKRARLPTKSLAYDEHIKGVIKTTKNCRIRTLMRMWNGRQETSVTRNAGIVTVHQQKDITMLSTPSRLFI